MAKTTFSTSNALTKKLWEEQLFREARKESYFSRFMGKGAGSMVQEQTDLLKQKGDKVTFGLRVRLSGSGVTSGQTLEGNEESLTTYDMSVSLEQYRHAVRDNGALDRQRAMFEIDEESKDALKVWMSEKIDKLHFDALYAVAPTKIFYGDGTSTATVTASGKLTPALISKARAWAKVGGGRTQPPIQPIKVDGKDHFVMLIHPDVAYDLKVDSTWTQAMREAEVRGKENPIFNGALALWDGVVIHEHENVPIVTTWGAGGNVAGAQNVFLGAQALVCAWGQRPKVVSKNFDYENEHGFAISTLMGVAKSKFNSLDFGVVGVYTARTTIN